MGTEGCEEIPTPPERKGWEAARPCASREVEPAKFHSLIEKNLLCTPTKRSVNFCGLCAARSDAEPLGGMPRSARFRRANDNFKFFFGGYPIIWAIPIDNNIMAKAIAFFQ